MKNDRPSRTIARLIKQFKILRQHKNMTHEELAVKSGVTRPAISHIEAGKRKPSLLISLRIANALGTELSELLREAEEQEKK